MKFHKRELWLLVVPLLVGAALGGMRFGGKYAARRQSVPKLAIPVSAPGQSFASVAISPDGKVIACGERSDFRKTKVAPRILLCNAASGYVMRTLAGHREWINELAFSPDGKLLASRDVYDGLRCWNTQTGRQLWFSPSTGRDGLAFTREGIYVGARNGVLLLDQNNGRIVRRYNSAPRQVVHNVAVSHDGGRLAAIYWTATPRIPSLWTYGVCVWSASSGKTLFSTPLRAADAIAFSDDAKKLISLGYFDVSDQDRGCLNGLPCTKLELSCFNVSTGRRLWLQTTVDHAFSLAVNTRGVIASGGSLAINFFNLQTGRFIKKIEPRGNSSRQSWHISSDGLAFSPDGRTLAACNQEEMHLWDVSHLP